MSAVESLAFAVASGAFRGLGRVRDIPHRRRHPGSFRVYWQPSWLTRWERRLAREG